MAAEEERIKEQYHEDLSLPNQPCSKEQPLILGCAAALHAVVDM